MQINEKTNYDARTFTEIVRDVTGTSLYDDLRARLVRRTGSCERTVDNWLKGRTRPINSRHKYTVSRVISDLLGIKTSYVILFP